MLASISSLILLSFAVSLDGFGVGITYGVRKIRIPLPSVWIISICSGFVILLSMVAGTLLARWLPPHGASAVGAVILIGIGVWALVQFVRGGESDDSGTDASGPKTGRTGKTGVAETPENRQGQVPVRRELWTLEIRQWGIIIQILRTPSAADMDRSGTISAGEAFLLGTALSLDAFGAGIGAAMVGFPPLLTAALIAFSSGSFLWVGTRVGFRVSGWKWVRQLTVLPGLILIAMGLFKLL
ncbi:sporulation membrane protein YtaF [Cohnella sp. CFH 77786]|uniref:MntP/YtaF family protein n=1 Tax=Cohnella sp. CFH 77786 TaxID=2662265 RepID=UPI001C609B61|nr:MntP/YtaF family protein [Cohnella sp. CFH 77786]MBW5449102.1 sporulation membrane protein YtaF [Cohnella sp. CFH 77786]